MLCLFLLFFGGVGRGFNKIRMQETCLRNCMCVFSHIQVSDVSRGCVLRDTI